MSGPWVHAALLGVRDTTCRLAQRVKTGALRMRGEQQSPGGLIPCVN